MVNYLYWHDFIYCQVRHIRTLKVWMLTRSDLVTVTVISLLALKIQAERSRNIPACLFLTAHLCRGINESLCLSLTPSLWVDVSLFTRLTKRILYTGNACECKSPAQMWGSLFTSTSIPDLHSVKLQRGAVQLNQTHGYI